MTDSTLERNLVAAMRIMIGWAFLYAGLTQVTDPAWSAGPFLLHTKTFHFLFAPFADPSVLPVTNFLVTWGHLLIGVSLVFGVFTRLGASFGALLMIVYWLAHMVFPYVDSPLNFLIDFHVVYAVGLVYVLCKRAGHIYGLDGWLENVKFVKEHPSLRPLLA